MSLDRVPNNYAKASQLLDNRYERKIANNTFLRVANPCVTNNEDDSCTAVISLVLHRTVVAEFHNDGLIWVGHGGYTTVTTKDRINRALSGTNWKAVQENWEWFLWNYRTHEKVPFDRAGMIVNSDGSVE